MLAAYILLFLLFLVLPLGALIIKSVQDSKGHFIGLSNYALYLKEPALFQSFFTADLIFLGKVDPHFLLMFKPFGLIPIAMTLAPNDFNNSGPAL